MTRPRARRRMRRSCRVGQASLSSLRRPARLGRLPGVAEKYLPAAARVTPVAGVPGDGRNWTDVVFRVDGERSCPLVVRLPAGDQRARRRGGRRAAADRERSRRGRARAGRGRRSRRGGAVVFVNRGVSADEATVVVRESSGHDRGDAVRVTVPAALIAVSMLDTSFQGVLSAEAAAAVGDRARDRGAARRRRRDLRGPGAGRPGGAGRGLAVAVLLRRARLPGRATRR